MKQEKKIAYISFLFLALCLPFFIGSSWYPREKIYLSSNVVAKGAADVHWMHHLIFEEKGPIDLLIIGASHSWVSMIPRDIERALSTTTKPFIVRTVAHNWCSNDLRWTLVQDLIAHREVRNVLIGSSPCKIIPPMHLGLYEIWPPQFLDHQQGRISFTEQFAIRMYEAPRKLLSLVRSDGPLANGHAMPGGFPEADMVYGNVEVHKHSVDVPFQTINVRVPDRVTLGSHIFDRPDDDVYLVKLYEFLRKKSINVYWLSIVFPDRDKDAHFPQVIEKWSDQKLFGLDAKTLFSKYSENELKSLYYDSGHMNINGAKLYTAVVIEQLRNFFRGKND